MTTNIGLLYPKVRKNIGGNIPIDVPHPKYWVLCPRHPRRGWRQSCKEQGSGSEDKAIGSSYIMEVDRYC